MKYKTKEIDIHQYLAQLNLKLSLIEVKGDSVEQLFFARAIVQQLSQGIETVSDDAPEMAEKEV